MIIYIRKTTDTDRVALEPTDDHYELKRAEQIASRIMELGIGGEEVTSVDWQYFIDKDAGEAGVEITYEVAGDDE